MFKQKKAERQLELPDEEEIAGPDDLLGPEPKGLLGAKRLNNKPVLIAGVVAAAFGMVMVYTMNERSKPHVPKESDAEVSQENGKAGAKATPPEVVMNAQQAGIVEASYEGVVQVMPDGTRVPMLLEEHPINTAATTGYAQPVQSAYATQWDNYYSQRDQQRQQRYETRMTAISAGTSVAVEARSAASQSQPALIPASMQGHVQGAGMAMAGLAQQSGSAGYGEDDLNRQGAKRDFIDGAGARQNHLSNRVESARSANEVKAGSVIPIVLTAGVNTDLPGQVTAAVTRNVYDSATGQRLLIPQGTRLVGQYHSQITTGQSRVLIAWNRLIFSDGSSLDIGSMPGADLSGASGARDQVNNHYRRTFGNAVFLSLFSAGVQLSQPQSAAGENQTSSQTVAAAMGQQLGQLGMETARRNMQIQPTLQLRPGLNMNIQVTQDITLREWRSR